VKPKPTMSQDGELRFTISVPVRAGLGELTAATAWRAAQDHDSDIREADDKPAAANRALEAFSSRDAVLANLRETVAEVGEHYHYWGDGYGETTCAAIQAAARARIEKLFPELKPKDTAP